MEVIISDLVKLMKQEKSFLSREKAMMLFFIELICLITQQAFKQLDDELFEQLKQEGYQSNRQSQRTITFLFGTVTYQRRRLKNNEGTIRYPLDEFLGIRKGTCYSSLVLRNVSELGSMMVYRHVSKAIDCLTTWNMSHQNVQQLVVKTGKLIQEKSTHEQRYEGISCKKKVPFLYLEGDGILIRGQRKTRLEIHRFQVSEGTEKRGNRSTLIHSHFVSHLNRQQAQKELMDYLQATYDLKETIVVSNSDGGSGYEKDVFEELSLGCLRDEHFRDKYHVHQKIKERLNFAPSLQKKLIEAVSQYDFGKVQACLDTAESLIEEEHEEKYKEQLRLLIAYLQRNWRYLCPLKARGIEDKQACIGTIESTHRKMTYRMKRQERLWTKTGASAMIRVIDSLRNHELDDWLNQYYDLPNDVYESEVRWKKMKRAVQRKPPFVPHSGAFNGRIAYGYASSSPLGRLSSALNQLSTTPRYL